MNGKGSGRRPLAVGDKEDYIDAHAKFESQWDMIFGGKNKKHRESTRVNISTHSSRDGGRKAEVCLSEDGYFVEFFEGDVQVDVVDVRAHSVHYAEDVAENYVLGIINPKESKT